MDVLGFIAGIPAGIVIISPYIWLSMKLSKWSRRW